MEPQAILYHLAHAEGLPEQAIRAAGERRDAAAPVLVDFVERYLAGETSARELEPALFFAFHLLGDWRDNSAYRPLARLLALEPSKVNDLLGDAITETSHRVMAAVFDGDPRPLYEVIEAEHADEFVRARMLETLAMGRLGAVWIAARSRSICATVSSSLSPMPRTSCGTAGRARSRCSALASCARRSRKRSSAG